MSGLFGARHANLVTSSASFFLCNASTREQLASDMAIKWNPRLTSTAGCTYLKISGGKKVARIELSTKVLDSYDKLRQTLCHEMCHAAAWVVDGVRKPPHGKTFKRWAHQSQAVFSDIKVTTCHSYKIHYKFKYKCTNDWCAQM